MTAVDKITDEWRMPTKWQGEATIEVYITSGPIVNVGNVTGSVLYGTIWGHLDILCPVRVGRNDMKKCIEATALPFDVSYKEDSGSLKRKNSALGNHLMYTDVVSTIDSLNQVVIKSSKFEDTQTRNLLIGAIAGAYQAMSENQRNCYNANDPATDYRYCNVALRVGAYTPGK